MLIDIMTFFFIIFIGRKLIILITKTVFSWQEYHLNICYFGHNSVWEELILQTFFRLFKLHIYGSFLSHFRIQNFVLIYKPVEKNVFFWVHEHIQPLSQEMSFLFLYLSLVLNIGYEKRHHPKTMLKWNLLRHHPHPLKVFKIIQTYLLHWSSNICTVFNLTKRCDRRFYINSSNLSIAFILYVLFRF